VTERGCSGKESNRTGNSRGKTRSGDDSSPRIRKRFFPIKGGEGAEKERKMLGKGKKEKATHGFCLRGESMRYRITIANQGASTDETKTREGGG